MILNILLFFVFQNSLINALDLCGSDGWAQYKDEKCIKIFPQKVVQFEQAEAFCISQSQGNVEENKNLLKTALGGISQAETRLLTVNTDEEQKFIADYLFSKNKAANDLWLGARFETTSKSFRWRANYNRQIEMGEKLIPVINKGLYSEKVYTNWQSGRPKTNAADQCVKMMASKNHQGQWIEVSCTEKNLVACERNQLWSVSKVQQALLKLEKAEAEMKATVQAVKNEAAKLKLDTENKRNELKKEAEKKQNELQKELKETKNKLENSIKQPVLPPNFIYVQFPWQQPPTSVYSWHQWEDITDQYHGAFFRAFKGGVSSGWTYRQPQSSPHIHEIEHGWCQLTKKGVCDRKLHKKYAKQFPQSGNNQSPTHEPRHDINVYPSGDWSAPVVTTANYNGHPRGDYFKNFLWFKMSNEEVRPMNYAIRIWRRK